MSASHKQRAELEGLDLENLDHDSLKGVIETLDTKFHEVYGTLQSLMSSYSGGGSASNPQQVEAILNELDVFMGKALGEISSELATKEQQLKKDEDFKRNSDTYFKGKGEELKERFKQIELVVASIRNAVNNIDPKTIVNMKVPANSPPDVFWKLLAKLLYNEEQNWDAIKKILKDNGDEFKTKIIQFDIEHIDDGKLGIVEKIKGDDQFQNWVKNNKDGEYLLDLCEWLDYIPSCAAQYQEYNQAKVELQKIKNDLEVRTGRLEGLKQEIPLLKENLQVVENLMRQIEQMKGMLRTGASGGSGNSVASQLSKIQVDPPSNLYA
eukprot:TRINITY_DN155_c0_g1_i6.p1 TRINITY_DN155_c0_g1~~TRINITY_DN155_c0_g1_i6.p1  ORF type:complete len:324 (-),score=75.97 TRINITY_DN155_c0_g1_i6:302-1273(-)